MYLVDRGRWGVEVDSESVSALGLLDQARMLHPPTQGAASQSPKSGPRDLDQTEPTDSHYVEPCPHGTYDNNARVRRRIVAPKEPPETAMSAKFVISKSKNDKFLFDLRPVMARSS